MRFGRFEAVKFLISHGCDVDDNENEDRITPLMAAADHSDIKCITTLLQAGCDVTKTDWRGRSALDHAIMSSKPDYRAVNLIYAAGSDTGNPITSYSGLQNEEHVQLLLDDKLGLQPLASICRHEIRRHLLKHLTSKEGNLFSVVPAIPLPTRIRNYLLFDIDLNNVDDEE